MSSVIEEDVSEGYEEEGKEVEILHTRIFIQSDSFIPSFGFLKILVSTESIPKVS